VRSTKQEVIVNDSNKYYRPDRPTHFFNRARVAAERSTCMRSKVGAVIVKDGVELSSGYVGSPRDTDHCIDTSECIRVELEIPSGERYELCRSVHAEQNAIINAARTGMKIYGAEIYISSERLPGQYGSNCCDKNKVYGPCIICKKEIINAGIVRVYMQEEGVGRDCFSVQQLIEMLHEEEGLMRKAYRAQHL
jgi:dCMP deaminase